MTQDELVEIIARALWTDWSENGKTATEGARGLAWETLVEGAATRPKLQLIVDDAYSQARAAIAAHAAFLSSKGLAVVPVEPTEAMKHDGSAAYDHPSVYMGGPSEGGKRLSARIWKAMLRAAARPKEGA